MDFTAFNNPVLNVKDWVNTALKNAADSNDKERNVSSLSVKLQIYYKQVNHDLKTTSHNVMNNLSRVLHEIDTIASEASKLKEKMTAVKQEITAVEKNTGASIASIEKIDKIKNELVSAKQALYEADNWTMLSNDIETVFETDDIHVIASKLLSMQQSLNALSNASDYDAKKTQLEGLKNRLEALCSPYVVEAMTTKQVEQSQKFVKIFEDMGRFPLLLKYYSKCQKVNLMQKWQSAVDLDTDENVIDCFQNLYDYLTCNWQEEVKWCQQVMPTVSAPQLLAELYTDLLTSLSPELSHSIENHIKLVDEPIPWLILAKSCSKSFAGALKSKLTPIVSDQLRINLAKAIYLPFIPYISKYGSYQRAQFGKLLTSLLISNGDVMERIQALAQMNSKVSSSVVDQRKLCEQLTESCCLPSFIVSVESYYKSYLEVYKSCLANIKELNGNADDGNTFQMCITLLQSLGEFAMYVKQTDNECVEVVLSNNFAKADVFELYPELLLDSERRSELDSLVQNLSESNEPSVLKTCQVLLESVCRDVYQTSFTVIFTPIATLLESVATVAAIKAKSASAELPDYSYTPQEYITQIGQYLMNLPQLLEPFLSLDNPSLNVALSIVGGEYFSTLSDDAGFVELFLGRITDATCRSYCDQILTLTSLSSYGCKQMATDINYLGNVLEDLGFPLSEKLGNVLQLLKLTPAEYGSQSAGLPPQLVAAVRQMRNILSE